MNTIKYLQNQYNISTLTCSIIEEFKRNAKYVDKTKRQKHLQNSNSYAATNTHCKCMIIYNKYNILTYKQCGE